MGKKQVTFADIAEYTHFSKTTISRYFNHPDSLTLENQEKISRALDELGYKKNKLAKVLANGKSEFVGIIVPNLYLHYYSEMLTQLLATYTDYHYKFLIFMRAPAPAETDTDGRNMPRQLDFTVCGCLRAYRLFPVGCL